jgi:hypothetical protein
MGPGVSARWVMQGCDASVEARGARGDKDAGQARDDKNAGAGRGRPTPAFKDGPIVGVVAIIRGGPSFRVRGP